MSIPTFPSTMLVDIKSNDPKEINDQVNKALNSLLSSLNKLSSSIPSVSGFITQAQAQALFAPLPQSAAGVGQVGGAYAVNNTALVLPAGGTWEWWGLPFNNSTNIVTVPFWGGGIAAGGTTVVSAVNGVFWAWWYWRIA